MPGSTPATSQLDWLISTTAMIVLSWSKATRDLLKACPGAGRGRSAAASGHSVSYLPATMVPSPSPPAPYHLSAGGRWIRTSGSAREEIEKSWFPVGVQLLLYGFARPRDRWFADSPLEGQIRTLATPHATASFASVRGCPSVIEKGSSSPGPATGLVYFSRGQSVSSN